MTDVERKELEEEFNKKYAKKIRRIEEKNFLRDKRNEIRKLRKDNRTNLGLTTTKLICYYMFGIFNVVLFYALIAMWHFADLSYLGVVISDILGQIVVFAIYSVRAYKDTNAEEKFKLERERLNTSDLPSKIGNKVEDLLSKVDDIAGVLSNDNSDTESTEEIQEDIVEEDQEV